MTDLHCHILPAIDDGAKNAKVSMELLRMQNDAGITDIVCTPHFNPDSQNLEDFIDKRYRSARYLMMYFKIGDIGGSHIVNVILKIAIACIPMAAFSYLTYQLVEKYNSFLALICCAVVGAVTYFCGMYVLKVEEISMILQQIKKKLYTNDDRRNNQ